MSTTALLRPFRVPALVAGLGLACALVAGCANKSCCGSCGGEHAHGAHSMNTVNTVCPGSGEPVNPDVRTVAFEGQSIGFCCDGCAGAFEKADAQKKRDMLASIR